MILFILFIFLMFLILERYLRMKRREGFENISGVSGVPNQDEEATLVIIFGKNNSDERKKLNDLYESTLKNYVGELNIKKLDILKKNEEVEQEEIVNEPQEVTENQEIETEVDDEGFKNKTEKQIQKIFDPPKKNKERRDRGRDDKD